MLQSRPTDKIKPPVIAAICSSGEILQLRAVLAGRVIGQLARVTAAPYIGSRQLVSLPVDYLPNRYSHFVHYGSRRLYSSLGMSPGSGLCLAGA